MNSGSAYLPKVKYVGTGTENDTDHQLIHYSQRKPPTVPMRGVQQLTIQPGDLFTITALSEQVANDHTSVERSMLPVDRRDLGDKEGESGEG